jgi:hypothetical protein
MSFVIGSAGLKGDFMQMSSFGTVYIELKNGRLNVVAENRKEAIEADLQKGETVDQFARRLKSILSGLMTAPPREEPVAATAAAKEPGKSFEEVVNGIKKAK